MDAKTSPASLAGGARALLLVAVTIA